MKVLIVDDNPRRYAKLMAATEDLISRDSVDIVSSSMDARHRLESTRYDILICDILIPLRAEGEPHERHSEELLAQICDDDSLLNPRRILGLTAYAKSADQVAPFFRDQTWTIIEYSETNDDWTKQIINCIRFMLQEERQPDAKEYDYDLAVICALNDPELKAVLALGWNFGSAKPFDDVNFAHEGFFKIDGRVIKVVAAAATRMGMVPTSLLTAAAIRRFKPRVIAMVGICAGVSSKAALGDILCADPCWDWQSGKRKRDDEENVSFAIAPHQIPIDERLRSKFEQIRGDKNFFNNLADRWVSEVKTRLKLVVGPVATGSAVLADDEIMDAIGTQHRELCGVEMEIYGFYYAATVAAEPKPLFFALKSVCDFGNNKKDDSARHYAAYTSAQTMSEFINRYFFSL